VVEPLNTLLALTAEAFPVFKELSARITMPRTNTKRKRTSDECSDSDAPLSDVENLRNVVIPVNNEQDSRVEDPLTATQAVIDTSANTIWSQATHRLFANTAEDFHLTASLQQLLEQYLISWCDEWCQERDIATNGSVRDLLSGFHYVDLVRSYRPKLISLSTSS
jgi:hypothetical protein